MRGSSHTRGWRMSLGDPAEAEADVGRPLAAPFPLAPGTGLAGRSERDRHDLRAVGPGATPDHLLSPGAPVGRAGGTIGVGEGVIPVSGPFPDAATHAVQAVPIRRQDPRRHYRELFEPVEV